ncbi:unnamed protein product [Effrenium voratum]|nr:unnamed protein product [Effrenium voratum]
MIRLWAASAAIGGAARSMYDLALVAIFKDEALSLVEWLDHYLREGVQQFYLIDHNSSDVKAYNQRLSPYVEQGHVQIFWSSTPNCQIDCYNSVKWKVRGEAKWVIVVDLDEYVYSRPVKGFHTIASYLASVESSVDQIILPSKNFGSSSHLAQPPTLVAHFLKRQRFPEKICGQDKAGTKAILRTSTLRDFRIHRHTTRLYTNDTYLGDDKQTTFCISEEVLSDSALHLNHYLVQSWQFFWRRKLHRGRVSKNKGETWSAMGNLEKAKKLFLEMDRDAVWDTELARKSCRKKCAERFPF